MTVTDIPFINVFDPTHDHESSEVAEAREAHWYATTPGPPMILRHEQARQVLRDDRFIHGATAYMAYNGVTSGPTYDWWEGTIMSKGANPPDHKRVRDTVQEVFTPRRVAQLRDFAAATAAELADAHLPAGESCDFSQFSRRYPALVICRLLGVPPEDFATFSAGASDIGLAFSREITAEQLPVIDAAVEDLNRYAADLITTLRAEPGDDLLSALVNNPDLSEDEIHNLTVVLVWSGQDTTHCQLGRAIVTFADHPDQWELVAEQPEMAQQAMEEVVRWSPQARLMWRIPTVDVQLDDLELAAGSMVFLNVVAANRDPRAFDSADRFQVTGRHRSQHLGFSHGMHHCLGAALARMEMAEALKLLTRRYRAPRLEGEIEWRAPQASIHGPERLPVVLPPRD
jgi:cytochrome P450